MYFVALRPIDIYQVAPNGDVWELVRVRLKLAPLGEILGKLRGQYEHVRVAKSLRDKCDGFLLSPLKLHPFQHQRRPDTPDDVTWLLGQSRPMRRDTVLVHDL